MSSAKSMLEAHPWPGHVDREVLAGCTEAWRRLRADLRVLRRGMPI